MQRQHARLQAVQRARARGRVHLGAHRHQTRQPLRALGPGADLGGRHGRAGRRARRRLEQRFLLFTEPIQQPRAVLARAAEQPACRAARAS